MKDALVICLALSENSSYMRAHKAVRQSGLKRRLNTDVVYEHLHVAYMLVSGFSLPS